MLLHSAPPWVGCICPPLFNTTVVLLNSTPSTMISALDCSLELTFYTHNTHVLLCERKDSSPDNKKAFLCQTVSRVNCGWHYVSIRVRPVRLRNVCYTCTDVSSIPHIVFLESMYIVKRIMVFVSLCISSLCGMFFINVHVKSPEQGKYFYQALLYFVRVYFLPSWELTRALNLSAFYHVHTIKLIE